MSSMLDDVLSAMDGPQLPADPQPELSRKDLLRRVLLKNLKQLATLRLEGLFLYRALPMAMDFHKEEVLIALLDGSNQSGKSITAAAEIAWRATATHPWKKRGRKKDRLILAVGPDIDHIADPMWKRLGEPGAFSVIRDEQTGVWRSVQPDPNDPTKLNPYDEANKEKWQDAPPLLPERFIRNIAWEHAIKRSPRMVELVNGTRILFRPSGGKAPKGRQLTDWWFDEEIENPDFLAEVLRGGMRFAATGFWSATPQTGGMQLYELHERAMAHDKDVKAFSLFIEKNPFIGEKEKLEFYNSLTDEQREVMYFGHYLIAGRRIYRTYDPSGIHGYEPFPIPNDWSLYIFVDPGHRNGTVFAAVDPKEEHLWIYESVEMTGCDHERWADMVWEKHRGKSLEGVVMDERAGQQTGIGGGPTVAYQYFTSLTKRGIVPRTHGSLNGFIPGTPNVAAREQSLVGMLAPRMGGQFEGTPMLQVARGTNVKLDAQIRKAHYEAKNPKKRAKDNKNPADVLDALEYGVHYGPSYRYPHETNTAKTQDERVFDSFKNRKKRNQRRRPASGVEF